MMNSPSLLHGGNGGILSPICLGASHSIVQSDSSQHWVDNFSSEILVESMLDSTFSSLRVGICLQQRHLIPT